MQMGDALEQIRVCVDIAIMCIESNPVNRPDLRDIITLLDEMESMGMVTETATSSIGTQVILPTPQILTEIGTKSNRDSE